VQLGDRRHADRRFEILSDLNTRLCPAATVTSSSSFGPRRGFGPMSTDVSRIALTGRRGRSVQRRAGEFVIQTARGRPLQILTSSDPLTIGGAVGESSATGAGDGDHEGLAGLDPPQHGTHVVASSF